MSIRKRNEEIKEKIVLAMGNVLKWRKFKNKNVEAVARPRVTLNMTVFTVALYLQLRANVFDTALKCIGDGGAEMATARQSIQFMHGA